MMANQEGGKDNPSFELEPRDAALTTTLQISDEGHDNTHSSVLQPDDEFEDLEPLTGFAFALENSRSRILTPLCGDQEREKTDGKKRRLSMAIFLALLLNSFLIWSLSYYFSQEEREEIDWCDGLGFLILIVVTIYATLAYYTILKPFIFNNPGVQKFCIGLKERYASVPWAPWVFYGLFILGLTVFVVVDAWEDKRRLISFFGIFVLIFLGFLHPSTQGVSFGDKLSGDLGFSSSLA
eukprot:TRINITY_DN14490_c0_g1_i1.p1 TRINITY_DN14490_c0_g1~~TRINITY_DN14490_c0_g1_i1.p1  ORF type:complete len:238 (+),score=34.15 TRINITY_DN14490_c0_g1_i1:67-780(+)